MTDQRKGGITWTDQTWNPVRGCRRKSDECLNCYAQKMAARFSGPGQPYHGLAMRTADGRGNWTGQIRMVQDHLLDPLRWQRPRLVFVNSMSDLFFEDLADTDIDQILAVMLLAKSHTFQVLTKRYDRMADYLTAPGRAATVAEAASVLLFDMASGLHEGFGGNAVSRFGGEWATDRNPDRQADRDAVAVRVQVTWPLPNVWWGFSAGRQKTYDEAMPHVVRLAGHAAVRWWSAEPLLEAIDPSPVKRFHPLGDGGPTSAGWWTGRGTNTNLDDWLQNLDWVVVGGESQTECRAMDPDWARGLLARCWGRTDMGRPWALPFHMKQLGGHPNPRKKLHELPPDLQVRDYPRTAAKGGR